MNTNTIRGAMRLLALSVSLAAATAMTTVHRIVVNATSSIAHAWSIGWEWVTARIVDIARALPQAAWQVFGLEAPLPPHLVAMRDYIARQVRLAPALLFPAWRMAPSV